LAWRMTWDARKDATDCKFALNWEGPFRVQESFNKDTFRLEHLRTWNVDHLEFYFS